ncbi:MAG: trigger factor [Desulfuromonadales bacterium]|nr:trigger factor [Desulfuromonadales bacterium]
MNVKVEDVSSITKKLTFEVTADQVEKEIARAFQKIGKSAKVKGFRAGKVPKSVLEKHYEGEMQQEVLTKLINDTYFSALDKHDIFAVSDPRIVDAGVISKGEPFSYAAEVDIKPEISVRDYLGIPLQKELYVEDPALVETRLEEMRTSRASIEVSERDTAQGGDLVQIDYQGFFDGEAFEGGSAEDYQLELGSNSFIPGFEEQLTGMRRGESKEINVTFPAEYGAENLAGKAATFKVTLHEIKEKVLPALDDEFAGEFGAESFDELKADLAASHRSREQNRIDSELREQLAKILIERNPFEIPEGMIAAQLNYMYDNIVGRMKAQGLTPEMLGMTPERFREQYRDTASDQVKGRLILEAVGRQEQIAADNDEIDAKLAEIAEMANAPLEMVQKYYAGEESRKGLLDQIAEEKTLQFLLDKAEITEVPAEQLAKEDA